MRTDKARPRFAQEAAAFIVPCCLRLILKCCGRYVIFTVAKRVLFLCVESLDSPDARTRFRFSSRCLYSLEYRGYDSAGVAAFTKDGLRVVKARGRIANLEEKIKEEGGDMYCTCGIGHPLGNARRAVRPQLASTSGRQRGKAAVGLYTALSRTARELRERLEAHGYEFQVRRPIRRLSRTSWTICTPASRRIWQKTVLQAVQRLRGSYALGVVSMDNTQEIVAARRGNPLVIGIGEGREA